jgi:hypothetical protein
MPPGGPLPCPELLAEKPIARIADPTAISAGIRAREDRMRLLLGNGSAFDRAENSCAIDTPKDSIRLLTHTLPKVAATAGSIPKSAIIAADFSA